MRTTLSIWVLIIALMGCGRPGITPPTAAQVAEFTRNASITLPVSAQSIGWRESSGMDNALWLQMRMPAYDLQNFIDSSPFRSATLTTNDDFGLFPFKEFIVTPPTLYRSGKQALPNAQVLNMVIDESGTTNVVVYLMWHET